MKELSKLQAELAHAQYEDWLSKTYPNYTRNLGLLSVLMFILFVITIVLAFWFDKWYVLSLLVLLAAAALVVGIKIDIKRKVDKYIEHQNK
ncbi:hypothetical protein Molly5_169 [Maribacter phage Molly_5]|uniref:Uncharacterized protein n=1 Tax=Maribacter phage Molly_1 TaxID=2745685 RepID=A0A8E4UYC9_9CAUD|nr:hypothetical protein M1M29_gp169 [Maribacter phage Molly_1]QQO97665.1 hypothetical protein Molly2_169 [Maribacter phage Molly_2]QQO97865.1 hypothetical protein Molly3_169 [Maribacter phage Molly_3]QQO98065.1 hypothetical protein Molly4_169 [Maribacter phage Molly_4]QQO98265.1 hypothetical protein Molly5_169 [Maribacter phage Molly_5]QQO97465.1 hypothetical protein Molly1_169 [Maribacter phage Molly_1]